MNHWLYKGEPVTELPEKTVGFVYKITNLDSGKFYIGRKYVKRRIKSKINTKSKTALNKKKTKITIKPSDWETYVGSNKPLIADIEALGKVNFKFEILYFGTTKGKVNYVEEFVQFTTHAMLNPNYYNDSVGGRGFIALRNNVDLLSELTELQKIIYT